MRATKLSQPSLWDVPERTLPADSGLCVVSNQFYPRHAWGRVEGAWVCTRCGVPMPDPAKILIDTVRGK